MRSLTLLALFSAIAGPALGATAWSFDTGTEGWNCIRGTCSWSDSGVLEGSGSLLLEAECINQPESCDAHAESPCVAVSGAEITYGANIEANLPEGFGFLEVQVFSDELCQNIVFGFPALPEMGTGWNRHERTVPLPLGSRSAKLHASFWVSLVPASTIRVDQAQITVAQPIPALNWQGAVVLGALALGIGYHRVGRPHNNPMHSTRTRARFARPGTSE